MNDAIQTERGGWQSLDNYCNNHSPGEFLMWSVTTMDEELLAYELGFRVVNEMITDWPDLMDLIYTREMELEIAKSAVQTTTQHLSICESDFQD